MSFKRVFRSLQEVFPQVDLRILKAVAMEYSKDVDAAVEFVLYEVLPPLNEPTEGSYNIDDTHARENSPVEFGVQGNFWDSQGCEEENTNLLPRSEGTGASLHSNVQGMYGTEATVNVTEVRTPAQNFPSSEEDMNLLIECEEPISGGLSKSDDIHAFSNLEINNSHSDAIASAQDMPSVSGDTSNLECGVDKVNQSSVRVFDEKHSRGISEICSEAVALETDMSYVAEKATPVGTQSGDVLGMDILGDFLSDVRSNKETLLIAFESVNNMMKDVELHEDRAKQAREEASKAGHKILTKAEDMKHMLIHAKEAKEMQATEVDSEKSLLATKAQGLQFRILNLSDQREKSLSIIEEIHQTLEVRLAAAKEVQAAAEQEKLEREEVARRILNEQEGIMEEIIQESKRLQQESQETAKLRELLVDRGRITDILQREMVVICEDVMLLKERVNGLACLSKSLPLTSSSLASSSSSSSSLRTSPDKSLHTVELLGGSPKSTTGEPLRNEKLKNDSYDNNREMIDAGDRGNKASSDDDWELFELHG